LEAEGSLHSTVLGIASAQSTQEIKDRVDIGSLGLVIVALGPKVFCLLYNKFKKEGTEIGEFSFECFNGTQHGRSRLRFSFEGYYTLEYEFFRLIDLRREGVSALAEGWGLYQTPIAA